MQYQCNILTIIEGLCGNCNGFKDDLKTKDGDDVTKDRKKFSKIGMSYLVEDPEAPDGERWEKGRDLIQTYDKSP